MAEWFLSKGEHILHKFDDLDTPLYLTNDIIVLTKTSWGSMTFQDISLKHLSSIHAQKKTLLSLVIAGIVILIVGLWLMSISTVQFTSVFGFILLFMGFVLIIVGLLAGGKEIVFEADSSYKIKVKLKSEEQIQKLVKTIREYE